MFDHLTISVSDLSKAKEFYLKALAPFGIKCVFEGEGYCGFGTTRPMFWIADGGGCISKAHIAFRAKNQDEVKAFYVAALGAGGKDNGAPGFRPEYHEKYYGAFVYDLDGNNIEAVFGND